MADTLCRRCESLELSASKFRITKKAREETNTFSPPELTSVRQYLGTRAQIAGSGQECKLCDLITDTLRDAAVPGTENVTCHLLWEMDGRTSADPLAGHEANTTRRLRICWGDVRLRPYEAYIMLLAPPKYDQSDIDYPGLLREEGTHFVARRIGSSDNKRNLIREFLSLCETHHDSRCTGKLGIEDPFRETLSEPYFGVIDMEYERLAPLPSKVDGGQLWFAPYATVSYVWGTGHNHLYDTRIGNIQSRRKSGGLSSIMKKLPRALRQSISLVHGLGIRYIWIDALCIVQDSSHSWKLNARAMHLIYGNSTLTVCAADGADATAGLVALDDDHRPRQTVVRYARDVCLTLYRPVEASIETTQWNKRAWTFQERLLSKRCLIFTEGKIFFQCRSTGMSEDVFADRKGQGWSLDLIRAPLQMLSQLKVRALWFYAHCVALYSKRDLYEPFDILAAFDGMCRLMQKTLRAPFVFGLPTSHFDLALLWQPVGRASRLVRANRTDDPKYKDMRFPSWSWCGWKAQGAVYDNGMVGGCMADARAWLLGHTWIDWHIRDGYGTLRRVWDAQNATEDASQDERWRGYRTDGQNKGKLIITTATHDAGDADYGRSDYGFGDGDGDGDSNHSGSSTSMREVRIRRNRIREERLREELIREERSRYVDSYLDRAGNIRRPGTDDQQVSPSADRFGRVYAGSPALSNVRIASPPDFKLTLPEDPYNVRTTEASGSCRSVDEFPDQPFLQFFTWKAHFRVVRPTEHAAWESELLPNGSASTPPELEEDLYRCDITDRRGDKCGSILVDNEWLRAQEADRKTIFEFIALSDAKEFTTDEFPDWTYYIPKERIESEWDLYYVLLVEYSEDEGTYRRVALGKIFKAAFTHSPKYEWKEIILG